MPAKNKFKTEEAYKRAIKREKANSDLRKEWERNEERKQISDCKIYARLPLRKLTDEEKTLCTHSQGNIWREECEKAGQSLRNTLKRQWASDNKTQAIITVDDHIFPHKGFATFSIELMAYGGKLFGEWLRNKTREAGFEISSYIPKAER